MVEKLFRECVEFFFYFYVFTLGAGPAIVDYIFSRYAKLLVRLSFALWITIAGYFLCIRSYHGFEIYLWGNTFYVFLCILGLLRRAKAKQKTFRSQYHLDWILVSLTTVLFRIFYVQPKA
jgi:hypothetical protein